MREAILATTLLALVGSINPIERPQEPVQATGPVTQQIVQEIEEKPVETPQLTWRDNPNNCEPTRIRADNLECLPPVTVERVASPVSTPAGDWVAQCHAWATEAGIALSDAAITLIGRESKCSPTICNPNGVACGIPQALPYTKMGCSLSHADAPCQLKWMLSYVMGRYGSWEAALGHSYANNWY